MMNSIYDSVQQNRMNNVSQQFNNFANNFRNKFGGMSPDQIGPQLVANGTIPPEQFEQFRQIANMVTGMNK